jgi:hypothetical protein
VRESSGRNVETSAEEIEGSTSTAAAAAKKIQALRIELGRYYSLSSSCEWIEIIRIMCERVVLCCVVLCCVVLCCVVLCCVVLCCVVLCCVVLCCVVLCAS